MLTSDNDSAILRSGTRVRASVRCLPRGQFQQIRKMFDHLSIIQVPVTDDDPLEKSLEIASGKFVLNVRDLCYLSIERVTAVKVDIRSLSLVSPRNLSSETKEINIRMCRDNRRRVNGKGHESKLRDEKQHCFISPSPSRSSPLLTHGCKQVINATFSLKINSHPSLHSNVKHRINKFGHSPWHRL